MEPNFTYTIADLGQAKFEGSPLAVIGHPISHSISPAMHNAAIAKMRLIDSRFNNWAYYRFDIAPEDFAQAIKLFHEDNFFGLNLTIPHKVNAMGLIYGVSADAEQMGAANTLVWGEHGYDGFNTDGFGLKKGLKEDLDIELKNKTVILLGSGGAARAAVVQCLLDSCAKIYIGNRSLERLEELMSIVKGLSNGERVEAFDLATPPADLADHGVLINATSLGLKAEDQAPYDLSKIPQNWVVYDMIYNPGTTRLLHEARSRGLKAANGLSMLVHQGARSLEIWSRARVDTDEMMRAACHTLDLPPRLS